VTGWCSEVKGKKHVPNFAHSFKEQGSDVHNPRLYSLFGSSKKILESLLSTMPCALRRDLSIILSTKQAQDLAHCCSRPSMSLSQPDDPSSTSTPPPSSPSTNADLVARVEGWLFKEDSVLPTSFFDLPRIESVVYPLTTANLWYLQGTLAGAEGMSCRTLVLWDRSTYRR
jgi:hypothetical protein